MLLSRHHLLSDFVVPRGVPRSNGQLLHAGDPDFIRRRVTDFRMLLNLTGWGLDGWQWLFIIEALPSILVGFGVVL
jgi:hypothetical protein